MWIEESLGFVPIASWYCEKACILVNKEFFAYTDQIKARSRSQLLSFRILTSISSNIRLRCSIKLLAQGDSVLVILTLVPRLPQSSINSLFADSPPLSVKDVWADP